MRRTVILYGLSLAALVALLKFLEYRFLMRDVSGEFYMGLLALVFTAIGIWAGLKLTRKKTVTVTIPVEVKVPVEVLVPVEVPVLVPSEPFALDQAMLDKLGISKREHEVLELMAAGLSNQEIADKLFLSLNTVKTHMANLFLKLEAKRRTQAVQRAKELMLIP